MSIKPNWETTNFKNQSYQLVKPAFYIVCVFLLLVIQLQAQQNLVVNGDFEQMSSCPIGYSDPTQNPYEIEKCIGWTAPTMGTSDYYNICSSSPNVSVPVNTAGVQAPFNGGGFLGGFFTNYNGGAGDDGYAGIMWWEYVQGRLSMPLQQGKIYKFSMEISVAEMSDLLINEVGAYLSPTPISSVNTASLTVTPQCVFHESNYFADTVNWMHLETYFIAAGSEQYVTIGNFRDNTVTDTIRRVDLTPLGLQNPLFTYLYIDNVILTESTGGIELSNVFTPNGDGINDTWTIPVSGPTETKVVILNRWGNLIYEATLGGFVWDGKTSDGDVLSDGVYFYRISNTNIAGFIQLVK